MLGPGHLVAAAAGLAIGGMISVPETGRLADVALMLLPCLLLGIILLYRRLIDRSARLLEEKDAIEQTARHRADALEEANKQLNHEISERRQSERQTFHLLEHDHLTDLPNRRLLMRHLTSVLERATATGRRSEIAVMMLDLDRFKEINDTLGHPAGDKLLKLAAMRLRDAVSPESMVARMGGDEFALVTGECDSAHDVALLAENVLAAFTPPFAIDNAPNIHSQASIGVALYPEHGEDADTLLSRADLALYEAKSFGRGRYSLYSRELHASMQARRSMETELRTALEEGQFQLAYQPRFSLGSRSLVAVEALLRWRHPTRGDIMPSEFIPLAETTGLIGAIGRWALNDACRQARQWHSEGKRIQIAVNLSPVQFRQHDIARQILEALDEHELPPELLELEITESVCMRTMTGSIERELQRIKGLGVRLAIDDFGTGYSSLSYLKWLPFDIIKIDRSFVGAMRSDQRDRAIVKTIITLAKSLGKVVVAEGVENDGQLDSLLELGCDEAQGYLLGRPMPASEVSALLAR